jgi:hypothetical protein
VSDDSERMREAVARLSADQHALVAKCLAAVVDGPYIDDDDEFHTVMGVRRQEATQTLAAWPEAAAHGMSFVAVNNALNNLLGYPHGRWHELAREIGAGKRDLAMALMAWRGEDRRAGGGKGYFDAFM